MSTTDWRASTFAGADEPRVEVAPGRSAVRVRDTKDAGLGAVLLLDEAAWFALLHAALGGAAGPLVDTGTRVTAHAGGAVTTQWHVTHAGRTLHFTDGQWTAFAAGVRAGEFSFAPTG